MHHWTENNFLKKSSFPYKMLRKVPGPTWLGSALEALLHFLFIYLQSEEQRDQSIYRILKTLTQDWRLQFESQQGKKQYLGIMMAWINWGILDWELLNAGLAPGDLHSYYSCHCNNSATWMWYKATGVTTSTYSAGFQTRSSSQR